MKNRIVSVLILSLILICSNTVYVKANNVEAVECVSDRVEINKLSVELNLILNDFTATNDKTLIIYTDKLNSLSKEEKKNILNELIYTVSNFKTIEDSDKNRISGTIDRVSTNKDEVQNLLETDVSKELRDSMTMFSFISVYINPVLGFIAYGSSILIVLHLLIEVFYLGNNLFRGLVTRDENIKPRFISVQAFNTIKEVEGEGKGVLIFTYIKKKAIYLGIVSICMGYLLRGRIFELFGNIINLFTGLQG